MTHCRKLFSLSYYKYGYLSSMYNYSLELVSQVFVRISKWMIMYCYEFNIFFLDDVGSNLMTKSFIELINKKCNKVGLSLFMWIFWVFGHTVNKMPGWVTCYYWKIRIWDCCRFHLLSVWLYDYDLEAFWYK